MIKFLIGGSPCTHWSIAQSKNRETAAEGVGWELFKNYLIAREKFVPDFFLYENNKSAAKAIKDQISLELGAPLQYINSALVSAQNRQRFYAHNCGDVPQPEDRGIILQDILETTKNESGYYLALPLSTISNGKSFCLTTRCNGAIPEDTLTRGRHTMVAEVIEPICIAQRGRYTGQDGKVQQNFESRFDGKTNTLTTVQKDNMLCCRIEPVADKEKFECLRAIYYKGGQRNFEKKIADGLGYQGVPVRIGTIENASKNKSHDSQQYRVYSPSGKSVTLCGNGGGMGAKTGLYACPIDNPNNEKMMHVGGKYEQICEPVCMCYKRSAKAKILRKKYENGESKHGFRELSELHPRSDGKSNTLSTVLKDNPICEPVSTPVGFDGDNPITFVSYADGKEYPVYRVLGGQITIKDKQYPIKLADGFYIIRKLTVIECCRLQTLPDDYCRAASATQAYKGLGNGWTAEVLMHILSYALRGVPKDEEIVVMSMYDGIGTGRYCFDRLGYKNIKYYAYEIDKYAMQIAMSNYPDIIQCGDAFDVRCADWVLPDG